VRVLELQDVLAIQGPALKAVSLAVGASAVFSLLLLRRVLRVPFLAWLGQFAFGIYLLHVFGAAGTRVALQRLGVDQELTVFLACLVIAMGLPIVFELTAGRIGWISWAVLGQKPRRRARPAGAASSREAAPAGGVAGAGAGAGTGASTDADAPAGELRR
jgi:peptidoglycan/LPS O-acetylase OafA/YrhL